MNVFTAVITGEQTERTADRTTLVRSSFAVTQAFKGNRPFDALVSYRSDLVSCGTPLEVGAEYLFFVQDSGEVNVCAGARPKEHARPEIAALASFAAGRRSEITEPWHFSSFDSGCTLITSFGIGPEQAGGVTLDGQRPGRASSTFGRAKIDVFPDRDLRGGELTLLVGDGSYQVATARFGRYSLVGDEADEVLRRTLAGDALRLRFNGLEMAVDTANLVDAGTGAQMLECIGPPQQNRR